MVAVGVSFLGACASLIGLEEASVDETSGGTEAAGTEVSSGTGGGGASPSVSAGDGTAVSATAGAGGGDPYQVAFAPTDSIRRILPAQLESDAIVFLANQRDAAILGCSAGDGGRAMVGLVSSDEDDECDVLFTASSDAGPSSVDAQGFDAQGGAEGRLAFGASFTGGVTFTVNGAVANIDYGGADSGLLGVWIDRASADDPIATTIEGAGDGRTMPTFGASDAPLFLGHVESAEATSTCLSDGAVLENGQAPGLFALPVFEGGFCGENLAAKSLPARAVGSASSSDGAVALATGAVTAAGGTNVLVAASLVNGSDEVLARRLGGQDVDVPANVVALGSGDFLIGASLNARGEHCAQGLPLDPLRFSGAAVVVDLTGNDCKYFKPLPPGYTRAVAGVEVNGNYVVAGGNGDTNTFDLVRMPSGSDPPEVIDRICESCDVREMVFASGHVWILGIIKDEGTVRTLSPPEGQATFLVNVLLEELQ